MKYLKIYIYLLSSIIIISCNKESKSLITTPIIEKKIDSLIIEMTLTEKIGQMTKRNG